MNSSPAYTSCPQCRTSLESLQQAGARLKFCPMCRFPLLLLAGKYRFQCLLGEGGFGRVYEVRHVALEKNNLRVVKLLKPERFELAGIARRFLREIQLTAEVSQYNEHIVRIYDDFGQHPELGYFYVMEHLEGTPLTDKLDDFRALPSIDWCLEVTRQLCVGLESAHKVGIIHRDLKPDNLFLSQQHQKQPFIKLLDFGIAGLHEGIRGSDARLTDAPLGTPFYMAPEQALNESPHTAVDLYAIGVILYEMLTGDMPFIRRAEAHLLSPMEVLSRKLLAELLPPEKLRPERGISPALSALVGSLLDKDPAKRPASVTILRQQLEQMQEPGISSSSHQSLSSRKAKIPEIPTLSSLQLEARKEKQSSPTLPVSSEAPTIQAEPKTEPVSVSNVAATTQPDPGFLPFEQDSFVGREEELKSLHQSLSGNNRLVTILGFGGMGKTRLALQYAHRYRASFPDGVWFCDLAETKTVEEICRVVAQSLGVKLGSSSPVGMISSTLQEKGEVLLVLDNFEQITSLALETVGQWLQQTEKVRFLVTSREVLHLRGEQLFELSPLTGDEAVGLFVQRAQSVLPTFVPTEEDNETLEKLVALLDCLPLAIELAAARIRLWNPATMVERMSQRFRVLTTPGGRDTRQATLRKTLEWSWELLEPDERAALTQLSVFEGGWTVEQAEAIVELEELWPSDALWSLLNKSLVRRVGERFSFLVSVHDYVEEQLEKLPAAFREALEERHGRWFATFGEDAFLESLHQKEGQQKRQSLIVELSNLSVACRRAILREDADIAGKTARAIWYILDLQGPFAPGRALLQEVLELPGLSPSLQARLHQELCWIQLRLTHAPASLEHGFAALQLFQKEGERKQEGRTLMYMGVAEETQGDFQQSSLYYHQALELYRQLEDRRGEGACLGNLGRLYERQGKIEEAVEYTEQALLLFRERGDRRSEARALDNLGIFLRRMGRYRESREILSQALALFRELDDRWGEGLLLTALARTLLCEGNVVECREHLEQAELILRSIEYTLGIGTLLLFRASLELEEGHPDKALATMKEAEELYVDVKDAILLAEYHAQRALLLEKIGLFEESEPPYQQATKLKQENEISDRSTVGLLLQELEELRARRKNLSQ